MDTDTSKGEALEIGDEVTMDQLFSPLELELLEDIALTASFRCIAYPQGPDDAGFKTDLVRRLILFDPEKTHAMKAYRRFACFGHELGHHYPDVVEFQDACEKLKPAAMSMLPVALSETAKKQIVDSVENLAADILLESVIPKRQDVAAGKLFQACFRENRGEIFLEEEDDAQELLTEFDASGRREFPWRRERLEGQRGYQLYFNLSLVAPFFSLPDEGMVPSEIASFYPNLRRHYSVLQDENIRGAEKSGIFVEMVRDMSVLIEKDLAECRKLKSARQALREYEEGIEEVTIIVDRITAPGEAVDAESVVGKSVGSEPTVDAIEIFRRQHRDQGADIFGGSGDIFEEMQIVEMARSLGVSVQSYRRFLRSCKGYQSLIDRLTKTLSQFVLQEYKNQVAGGQRNGFMATPGREVETYIRARSGEATPPTLLGPVMKLAPKSLQIYQLIDTSTSQRDDAEGILGYTSVFGVSGMNIQNELRSNPGLYNLRRAVHAPFELEQTGFHDAPFLAMPLGPVSLQSLAVGYERIHDALIEGGGTNDRKALEFEYARVRMGDPRTLKIFTMVTDGLGQGDKLDPILDQIKADRDIYFLVHGVGERSGAVLKFYLKKFLPRTKYMRLFADESATVREAIIKTVKHVESLIANFFS